MPMVLRRKDEAEALALLTVAQMGAADAHTIASGLAGIKLMEWAGTAVADDCAARFVHGTRVAVICGPGNNGGDGFVAARKLKERGFIVTLGLLGDRQQLKGDAALAAQKWRGEVQPAHPALFDEVELIVDALFGAGLSRPIEGEALSLIEAINAAKQRGATVVSVDLPSGISGDSGQVMGVAVEATRSITFFRKKPGHVLLPGRSHCGRVCVADIGIRDAVLAEISPTLYENDPALWREDFPQASVFDHKFSRGAVLVLSGGASSCGAARLASASALRSGAGLVVVASPQEAVSLNAAYLAALIVRPCDEPSQWAELLSDPRIKAAVIGPGAGVNARTLQALEQALARTDLALVLDADAISLIARGERERLFNLIKARTAPVVLTPHEGEFARLFGEIKAASKVERAGRAASLSGAIIVYKGGDTVIADPDGTAVIETRAPQWLATAGSGDVLVGCIAGLLAQGMEGMRAASAGVHLHGQAGALHGRGLIADDLPSLLPKAISNVL